MWQHTSVSLSPNAQVQKGMVHNRLPNEDELRPNVTMLGPSDIPQITMVSPAANNEYFHKMEASKMYMNSSITNSSAHLTPVKQECVDDYDSADTPDSQSPEQHDDDDSNPGCTPLVINTSLGSNFPEQCPVCGDKVSGYHYGLPTCESCKGFFKRTVQNKKEYQCSENGLCVIDKVHRKRCAFCRYQKCIKVGMKVEAVREDRMRGGRNKFAMMGVAGGGGGPSGFQSGRVRSPIPKPYQRTPPPVQMPLVGSASTVGVSRPPYSGTRTSLGYAGAGWNAHHEPHMATQIGMHLKQEPSELSPHMTQHLPTSSPGVRMSAPWQPPHDLHNLHQPTSHHLQEQQGYLQHQQHLAARYAAPEHQGPPPQPLGSGGYAMPTMGRPPPAYMHPRIQMSGSVQSPPLDPHDPPSVPRGVAPAELLAQLMQVAGEHDAKVQDQARLFVHKDLVSLNLAEGSPTDQMEKLFRALCFFLEQSLFQMVDWVRKTSLFKNIPVNDQMQLLHSGWSEVLLMEFLHHYLIYSHNDNVMEAVEGLQSCVDLLDVLEQTDSRIRLVDLIDRFAELNLDSREFTCLKFLLLFNPGKHDLNIQSSLSYVEDVQEQLCDFLTNYERQKCPGRQDKFGLLLLRLPEVKYLAFQLEGYLLQKFNANEIPKQSLLAEMLTTKRRSVCSAANNAGDFPSSSAASSSASESNSGMGAGGRPMQHPNSAGSGSN